MNITILFLFRSTQTVIGSPLPYIFYRQEGHPELDAWSLGCFVNLKVMGKKDFVYLYLFVWLDFNGKNLIYDGLSNQGY